MSFRQKNVVKNIINVIFPVYCRGCGDPGDYLCQRCKNYISEMLKRRSILNGKYSSADEALIAEARTTFKRVEYLGFRDEILGELIEECKYESARGIIPELADIVLKSYFSGGEPTVLVPMPTNRRHVRERGFDHMDLLAKYIERNSGGLVKRVRLLERAKDTVQVGTSGKIRRVQAKEAVKLNPKFCNKNRQFAAEYRKANVVLIDDVWTTGASMIEAGKILRKAGINSLFALAITKNRAGRSPVIRHGEIV